MENGSCGGQNVSFLPMSEIGKLLNQFIPYMVAGAFTVLSNFWLILAILPKKELRSKYILILALASGDACNGFGYLLSGKQRLGFIMNGQQNQEVTHWECATRGYMLAFLVGEVLPLYITLVIAVERIVAVTWPLQFAKVWSVKKFVAAGVVLAYLITGVYVILALLSAGLWLGDACEVLMPCYLVETIGNSVSNFKHTLALFATLSFISVYFAAIIIMLIQGRRLQENQAAVQQLKRQARITKVMLVIVVLTFIFVMRPTFVQALLVAFDIPYAVWSEMSLYVWMWVGYCLSSGVNTYIYAATNPELRAALIRIICPCEKPTEEPAPGTRSTRRVGPKPEDGPADVVEVKE